VLHFAGGFVREGQPKDVLARKAWIGLEEIANAFGDDARFTCAGAGHDQARAVAMFDRGPLFIIQRKAAFLRNRN
jgi:hypothetical protein